MVSKVSIDYYNRQGAEFARATSELDLQALYLPFLEHLPVGAVILDAGCGSGRASLAFLERGYQVLALDASHTMVQECRLRTGLEPRCQSLESLDDEQAFDGIWACASLLHIPRRELGNVFSRLHRALRPEGVLYASFKLGATERTSDGRHFSDFPPALFRSWLEERTPAWALSRVWETADVRLGREHERWLNLLLFPVL